MAESRLSRLPDGRVCYELKRAWKDGTTHVVLEPSVLIERLVALIPRPRKHLVTYHGVLAPASRWRAKVVPRGSGGGCGHAASGERFVPHAPRVKVRRRRYAWADLLRRVFLIDVLRCPCGGRRRVLSAVLDRDSLRGVCEALGLSAEAPELAPARAPPGAEDWLVG